MVKGYACHLLKNVTAKTKKNKEQAGQQMNQDQKNIDRYGGVHYTILFWGMFKIFPQ